MATTVAQTVLEFVSDGPIPGPDPSPIPTTGDALGVVALLVAAIFAAAVFLFAASFLKARIAAPAGAHVLSSPRDSRVNVLSKLFVALAAACLVASAAFAFAQPARAAAYIDIDQKVTIVVAQDASIESAGTAELRVGDATGEMVFVRSYAEFTSAIADTRALADLTLTARIPSGVLYSGPIDGSSYFAVPADVLKAGDSLTVAFEVSGLTTSTMAALVNKGSAIALSLELAEACDVTFDVQGHGTAPAALVNVPSGSKLDKPADPTEAGYTFGGWYKEAACVNAWDFDADTVASDMTLYAKWAPSTYTLTLNANGGTVDGESTIDKTVTFGEPIGQLPDATSTDGSLFVGWYTAQTGGAKVTADTIVDQPGDFTAYAQWKDNQVDVYFDLSGGGTWQTVLPKNPNTYSVGEKYDPLPVARWTYEAARDGYEFEGWFTEKVGGTKVTTETTVTNYDDHSLYPHWKGKTVELTLRGNGGTINGRTDAVLPVTFGGTYAEAFDKASAVRTGYVLKGYFNMESGGAEVASDDVVTVAYPHQLYAQWMVQTYDITVKDTGGVDFSGTLPEGFPTTHTYDTTTALPAPSQYGYTFCGWFMDAACMGSAITELAADSCTADVTLYAKWEPIVATVSSNANGGSGTMSDQVFEAGETKALSPCALSAQDTDTTMFFGWNTKADGTGDAYADGQQASFVADTTLYAQWIQPLRFVANAGSSGTVELAVEGELSVLSEFVYSKDGEMWLDFAFDTPVSLASGEQIFVRAKTSNGPLAAPGKNGAISNYTYFKVNGSVAASGNTMSLLDNSCKLDEAPAYAFANLFSESEITTAPDLPATTLGEYCYDGMFAYCESLTAAASMDAEVMGPSSCHAMYADCTNLTDAGTLPATTLADSCYMQMFSGCTSLSEAPALPAMELAEGCYRFMFALSGVAVAPDLLATTLASYCYQGMFQASAVTVASDLPAITLAPYCYQGMFGMCPNL